jgi:hypothetical protein
MRDESCNTRKCSISERERERAVWTDAGQEFVPDFAKKRFQVLQL